MALSGATDQWLNLGTEPGHQGDATPPDLDEPPQPRRRADLTAVTRTKLRALVSPHPPHCGDE